MHQLTRVKRFPFRRQTPSYGAAAKRCKSRIGKIVWAVVLAGVWLARSATPSDNFEDVAKWMIFTSKAAWSIRYPGTLKVGSCRQCSDPTAPDAFVVFRDPSTGESIMVEPLEERPADQTIAKWLQEVSQATVANPRVSDEWIYVDGRPALKVTNKGADSIETSNIYIVNGSKTLAIRISNTHKALYEQMLSTFRF